MTLEIFPRCASPETFRDLHSTLRRVTEQLAQLPFEYWSPVPQDDVKRKIRQELPFRLQEYARSVRFVYELRQMTPGGKGFQDHDWLASYLLYFYSQYNKVREHDDADRSLSYLTLLTQALTVADHRAANLFREANSPAGRFTGRYDVGILTVRPAEYHSVVRRLDTVERCTGPGTHGFQLLERKTTTEDLSKDVEGGHLGWTVGRIGKCRVLVLCTCRKGKEATKEALDAAVSMFNNAPRVYWLVVGFCATTNVQWPVGTILVSQQAILDVKRTHSRRFDVQANITPVPIPAEDRFACRALYRRPPIDNPPAVRIARPQRVSVKSVPFACTGEVINEEKDREALRRQVCGLAGLDPATHIGIEMEGAGIAAFGQAPVGIVKAVSDYADEKKSDQAKELQVLLQLYAAETAADYVCRVLEKLNPDTEAQGVP